MALLDRFRRRPPAAVATAAAQPQAVTDTGSNPNKLTQGGGGLVDSIYQSTSALINTFTGLGTSRDPAFFNTWAAPRPLTQGQQFGMGRNALISQALRKLPDAATSEGWRVQITDERVEEPEAYSDSILAYEKRLGIGTSIARALYRSSQYGQAIVLLGVEDGQSFCQPVDWGKVKTIRWAAVVDSRDFQPREMWQASSPHFGKVKKFLITDLNGVLEDGLRYGPDSVAYQYGALQNELNAGSASGQLEIHADRVLHFHTTDYLSILDTLQGAFGGYFTSMAGIQSAAREASVVVYKITDWIRKAWSDDSNLAHAHMSFVDKAKSTIGAWVIDKDKEDVEVTNRSLGGVADLSNPSMVEVSASLAIPVTQFWGVSPGGFGKGEAETEVFNSAARALQRLAITPQLNHLHELIFVAEDGCQLPRDTEHTLLFEDLSPPDETARGKLRSEALSDLRQLVKDGIITRVEARPAVSALVDDYFRPQVDLDADDDAQTAAVGVFTSSILLMQSLYPAGVPVEGGRALMQALAPMFFNPENVTSIFPDPTAPPAPLDLTRTATGAAEIEGEDAEPSDVDVAWSENPLPEDALEAPKIAAELGVPTVRVTRAHRAGMIEGWNILGGKPRYSLAAVKRVVLEGNGKLSTSTPVSLGDVRDAMKAEASLALVLRCPADVAQWVPYKADEPSPPHATLLYVGKVAPSQVLPIVDAVRRVLADTPALSVTLTGVEYFDNDQRVAYAAVHRTPELHALHNALLAAVTSTGAEVKHYPGGFTPHVTLAYLPPGTDYTGPVPPHGWTANEIEVWYGDLALPLLCAEQPLLTADTDTGDGFFESGSDPKVYTKPDLRNRLRSKILREGKGGKPRQWSARKAQLLALEYKRAGGGYRDGFDEYEREDYDAACDYVDSMDASEAQKSLSKWTQEEWKTCLPSGSSNEPAGSKRRYLPARACEKLSPAQRRATGAKKAEGASKGKQFVANTEAAAKARTRATDDADDDDTFADFDGDAYEAQAEDMTDEAREKRISEAFTAYREATNMGASELKAWSETAWSKKAGVSREPITRNLRLLQKKREDWTLADATAAMRTVSFVSRMRGNARGEPVKVDGREGPSKRDISLKNWAFDPGK